MSLHLNILNFVTEDKFLDGVIDNHDLVTDNVNHFYVIVLDRHTNKESYLFKYIKHNHRVDKIYETEIQDYIGQKKINAIILHSLYSIPIKVIPQINKSYPILWNAWGADMYEYPYLRSFISLKKLYLPYTKEILDSQKKKERGTIYYFLSIIKKHLVQKHVYTPSSIRKAYLGLDRINFFSGVIDFEYNLMKENSGFKAEKSIYSYGSFSRKLDTPRFIENNILLGNSANPTNNHVDLLHVLKDRGIVGKRIITPLNYGGPDLYIDKVCETGRNLYGKLFQPLTNFLPFSDYLQFINSCGVVIIGTMRQQAMGNLSIAIRMGCKLFLLKDSILYKHFKNNGFIIFSIEDDLTNESVRTPLSEIEINYNIELLRTKLSERWNPNALTNIYTQFRNYIKNNVCVTQITNNQTPAS